MSKQVNITLIVDRSGSMSSIANEVIGGINAFYDEQKKLPDPATVTYVQFDNVYEQVFKGVALGEVEYLNRGTFVPRGMTALYDAIGKTLLELNPQSDAAQIIVIMTDGAENSSKEFTHETVKKLVEASQAKGWQIIFMGANIDAQKVGGSMGIKTDYINTFAASATGATATFDSMSTKLSSVRSAYSKGASNWQDAGGTMADLYDQSVNSTK